MYALEWTSEAIRVWHWPRQSIPADILCKKPDPSTWGLPTALFGTSTCEVGKYFKDMSIVIQTVRDNIEQHFTLYSARARQIGVEKRRA